jgi:hypothetical protein
MLEQGARGGIDGWPGHLLRARLPAVVEPEHPMCATHWALVPPDVQAAVRRQWRRG